MACWASRFICLAMILGSTTSERKVLVTSWGLYEGEFQGGLTKYFDHVPPVDKVLSEPNTTNVIWATSVALDKTTKVHMCSNTCTLQDPVLYETHKRSSSQGAEVLAMTLETRNSRRHLLLGLGFSPESSEVAVRVDLTAGNNKTVLLEAGAMQHSSWVKTMAFVPSEDYAFVFQDVEGRTKLSVCDYNASIPCILRHIATFEPYGTPRPDNATIWFGVTPECSHYHKPTETLFWGQKDLTQDAFHLMSATLNRTSGIHSNFTQAFLGTFAHTANGIWLDCSLDIDEEAEKIYLSISSEMFRINFDGSAVEAWTDHKLLFINDIAVDRRRIQPSATSTSSAHKTSTRTTESPSTTAGVATTADGTAETTERASTSAARTSIQETHSASADSETTSLQTAQSSSPSGTTTPGLSTSATSTLPQTTPQTTPASSSTQTSFPTTFTHVVTMAVRMEYSLAVFNEKESEIAGVFATVANVHVSQVTLTAVETEVRRQLVLRRFGTAVDVDVEIETESHSAGLDVVSAMSDTAALNAALGAADLQPASVTRPPAVSAEVITVTTTPPPSEGCGFGLASKLEMMAIAVACVGLRVGLQ